MQADLSNEDVGMTAADRLDAELVASDPLAAEDQGLTAAKATTTGRADAAATGYCLWEYDGASWMLKKDRSELGHVPSPPPAVPGRFRGHLRAVMSVPAAAIAGKQAMLVPDTNR